MRHCYGENVDVYEITGNKVSKLFKKAGEQIKKFEEDSEYYSYSVSLTYLGESGIGADWALTVYAHS